jgi:methylated-DNA-[protein]-cysteine S-methyltransferase
MMRLEGTEFQVKVWRAIAKIPKGEVRTYKQLARTIKKPKAIRAVANACGKNPYPIKIPCHRVVGSNGCIGGYSGKGGVRQKKNLLRKEGVTLY